MPKPATKSFSWEMFLPYKYKQLLNLYRAAQNVQGEEISWNGDRSPGAMCLTLSEYVLSFDNIEVAKQQNWPLLFPNRAKIGEYVIKPKIASITDRLLLSIFNILAKKYNNAPSLELVLALLNNEKTKISFEGNKRPATIGTVLDYTLNAELGDQNLEVQMKGYLRMLPWCPWESINATYLKNGKSIVLQKGHLNDLHKYIDSNLIKDQMGQIVFARTLHDNPPIFVNSTAPIRAPFH